MRCRCCNSPNARRILGDYYCYDCSSSIHATVKEDKAMDFIRELNKVYYEVNKEHEDGPSRT